MSRNNINIEESYRSHFGDYSVEPTPGLWSKVRTRIMWKQFLSFNLNQFNLYYLTAALAVAAGGIILITSKSLEKQELPAKNIPEAPVLQEEILDNSEDSPVQAESKTGRIKTDIQEVTGDISGEKIPAMEMEKNTGTSEEMPGGSESGKPMSEDLPSDDEAGHDPGSVTASISFNPSQTSGCAPLAVNFMNTSVNGEKYQWNFGDGGSSADENPSYVFDESGEYSITLHMTGKNGLEYMQQQAITVFETPSASFEVDEDVDLQGPVYFYNYSRSADHYRWEFGDRQGSGLSDPVHYYDNPGTYHVKLIVWTKNQCFDSLTILNAFKSEETSIKFPNAFTPNLNGPSGGHYNGNDIGNTIFHPVIDGELIEYQLRIFNRFGVLLFESTDIHIGWDGYYQEELGAQGVYIWKARGKFSSGKTFVESGDVTLVKKY